MCRAAPWRAGLAALTLASLAACSGAVPKPEAPAPEKVEVEPERKLIREIVRDVVALRGLVEKNPLRVEIAGPAEFRRALERHLTSTLKDTAPDEGTEPEVATLVPDLAQILLGFYDWEERAVFVQKELPDWAEGVDLSRVLAHEITHALQDQHFDLALLLAELPLEQRLAAKALIEGDAELVAQGVQALREGRSARRAMARAFVDTSGLEHDVMAKAGMTAPAVADAGALPRAAILFQYVEGGALAADLYRAGGFSLVDQAFGHPPRSTQQVLHVQKYLDGVLPALVGLPAAPAGYRVLADHEFGELFSRELFREQVELEEADRLASAWVGGRSVRFANGKQEPAAGWLSVWQSATVASRVEALLRKGSPAKTVIQRSGARVVALDGLPRSAAKRYARAWLKTVETTPNDPPPFASTALVPPPASVNVRLELRGNVKGRRYLSEYLGVGAEIPPGFRPTTRDLGPQLRIAGGQAAGMFAFIDEALSGGATETAHRMSVETLAKTFNASERPTLVSTGPIRHGLGRGTQWSWHFARLGIGVRSTLVETCRGLGSWQFIEVWRVEAERRRLAQWIESFRTEGQAPSPACRDLARDESVP